MCKRWHQGKCKMSGLRLLAFADADDAPAR